MIMKCWQTLLLLIFFQTAFALPAGFVYLADMNPDILQEIRYAGEHNFIGRPVAGYDYPACILSKPAALALSRVQKALSKSRLTLKVYDCYRPTSAVADFVQWSKDRYRQEMKQEFYPNINKSDLFRSGYIAKLSGHSRGSTVDVTIVPMPVPTQSAYRPGQKLVPCTAPYQQRFRDNSLDMGTGFDCFSKLSHALNTNVGKRAHQNRLLLRQAMMKQGFEPYANEWWHFTLKNGPHPHTYFNFSVKKAAIPDNFRSKSI